MVNNGNKYGTIGFVLLLTGFLVIAVSIIIFAVLSFIETSRVETGVGGCIIIFFIPICFVQGTPNTLPFVLLLTIIIVISILVLIILTNLIHLFISRKSYIPTRIHK